MSFQFTWPRFSDEFHEDAKQMLNTALNKGTKPRIIADKIEVVELEMGTQPPELEIRDIGEITTDQFRGIFRLSYAGDAHIVLRTKVQANPMTKKRPDMDVMGSSRGVLAAHQPLVVPMLLRLSHFRLSAYVVLVVSKQKGITLVFKTDPLQNVDVNSTFDSIAVIQSFIQKEIEGQLREMFREDLPGIIHRLSQKWTAGKTKVEAPYLNKQPVLSTPSEPATLNRDRPETPQSPQNVTLLMSPQNPFSALGLRPTLVPRPMSMSGLSLPRPRISATRSVGGSLRISRPPKSDIPPPPSPTELPTSSHPDLELFDPTYGLRPEGLPTKSGYSGFGKLFGRNKGLGSAVEGEQLADGDDYARSEAHTFDMVDWDDALPEGTTQAPSTAYESVTEYESLPAVGGGTITRPRVYHSQSQIQVPGGTGSVTPSLSRNPSQYAQPSQSPSRPARSHPLAQSFTSVLDDSPHSSDEDPIAAWRAQTYRQAGNFNPYFPDVGVPGSSKTVYGPVHPTDPRGLRSPPHFSQSHRGGPARRTSSSSYTHPSGSSSGPPYTVSTPPSTDPLCLDDESPLSHDAADPARSPRKRTHDRRRSLSPSAMHPFDSLGLGSPPRDSGMESEPPSIVLRPNLNTSVQHLSALSLSNHTLSPYTHSLEHFAVRSGPPRPQSNPHPSLMLHPNASHIERKPVKARRKRTFRLGGSKDNDGNAVAGRGPGLPSAPSEFSAEDVDHYFRSGDSDDPIPRSSIQ